MVSLYPLGFSVEAVTPADLKAHQDCAACARRDSCEGVICEKVV